MSAFTSLTSTAVLLPVDNVDTDQIIPARYLKATIRDGLGDGLFADWRYDQDGHPKPDFPLNQPGASSAQILVAGDNFGCGSSREHAPWALLGFGFRAVISTRFADIFQHNSLGNGLLPVVVNANTHARIFDLLRADPSAQLTIDLATQTLTLPDGTSEQFPIDQFDKYCLLQGVDKLGYLLAAADEITRFEERHDRAPLTTPLQPA